MHRQRCAGVRPTGRRSPAGAVWKDRFHRLKPVIRLAVRALNRPRNRKSASAITGDILGKLLATCSDEDLTALRNRAILMVAFAAGANSKLDKTWGQRLHH